MEYEHNQTIREREREREEFYRMILFGGKTLIEI